MRFLHFILSHSIFIALCAVGLCYQTYTVLGIEPNVYLYCFVFFSTICSYNFYWLLSKYYFSSKRNTTISFLKKSISFIIFFICGGLLSLYYLIKLPQYYLPISIALALTLLYGLPLLPASFTKKLQHIPFLKTILLAFSWAFITVVLPAFNSYFLMLNTLVSLFIHRFLFMLLLCIIFDKRDATIDKINGLHSLATDVSSTRLLYIINIVFVVYFLISGFISYTLQNPYLLAVFFVTGFVTWFVYLQSFKKQGYIFYYFGVDGLMLFSGLITYLVTSIKML